MSYIYALIDPRNNKIRYIGKSNNPKRRLSIHLNDKTSNKHKINWINQLKTLGLKPILKIIGEYNDSIVFKMEVFWIDYFKRVGCDLTNITDGGDSGPVKKGKDNYFYGKKYLGEDNWMYGKPGWNKGMTGYDNHLSKTVLQIDKNTGEIIEEFGSTKEAGRIIGIGSSEISKVCNNKPHYNTAGGFIWKYK